MNILARMGRGTVFFAAAGVERKWKMQREMLSSHYTTSWDELPVVKRGKGCSIDSRQGSGEDGNAISCQQQNRISVNNGATKREKHVGNWKSANTNPAPFIMENITEKNAF